MRDREREREKFTIIPKTLLDRLKNPQPGFLKRIMPSPTWPFSNMTTNQGLFRKQNKKKIFQSFEAAKCGVFTVVPEM